MNELPIRDDEELIELFLAGCRREAEEAFEAIVLRHGPAVMRVCRRILEREGAEDAAQATYVALFRNAGRIRHRRALGSWLCGVAYRISIRMRAESARRRAVHSRAGEGRPPMPAEDAAALGELREILRDEVDCLPGALRTLVVRSYLEGWSNSEVARSLGCSIGTVKGQLWRARGILRARLSSRAHGAARLFA
jgi:RNA polymerase sigma factor (sigma-70 family)